MKAMILAAGLGTRMRPLTEHTPKPLIEVGGKKLIDWSLDALAEAGVKEVVINCSYLAEQVQAHAKTRDDLHITLSHEDTPLETGGGIKKALPHLGGAPFLVMNSDAFCYNGAAAIRQLKAAATAPITLLLQPCERAVGYTGKGDFFLNDAGQLRRRLADDASAPYVFTGMQIVNPFVFEQVEDEKFSMNLLYDKALEEVGACVHDGVWLHVGTPEEKAIAEAYLKDKNAA